MKLKHKKCKSFVPWKLWSLRYRLARFGDKRGTRCLSICLSTEERDLILQGCYVVLSQRVGPPCSTSPQPPCYLSICLDWDPCDSSMYVLRYQFAHYQQHSNVHHWICDGFVDLSYPYLCPVRQMSTPIQLSHMSTSMYAVLGWMQKGKWMTKWLSAAQMLTYLCTWPMALPLLKQV